MTKKHIMAAAVLVGVGTLGIAGLASAASMTATDTLAGKLAQKFNLKESDVQAVIDDHKSEYKAEHEQKYEDRLTQAVKDGKLTADQKAKVLAKHNEIKSFMDTLRDKTPDERRTALKQKMDDVRAWEKANSIPMGYLVGMVPGKGHGFGPRMSGDDAHRDGGRADENSKS